MNPRVYTSSGHGVVLARKLGGGGEGTTYAIEGNTSLCAKIYSQGKREERREKILAMVRRNPSTGIPHGAFAELGWPVDPLFEYGAARSFIGFVMPAFRSCTQLYRLIQTEERMHCAGFLTWKDLHEVAARIADLLVLIHAAGHCVGDVNPQNFLVRTTSLYVAAVDTDSFQIQDSERRYACLAGTPDYDAPEVERALKSVVGGKYAEIVRTASSDSFSLGVLIYRLLFGGVHPFDVDVGSSTFSFEERVRRGLAPSALSPRVAPPPATLLPDSIAAPLRQLFHRCFVLGSQEPAARPRAAEWARALREAAAELVQCSTVPSHFHARHGRCPWCARYRLSGLDEFPPGQAWQRDALAHCEDEANAPVLQRKQWFRRHVDTRLEDGVLTQIERDWLQHVAAVLGLTTAVAEGIIVERAQVLARAPSKAVSRAERVLAPRNASSNASQAGTRGLTAILCLGVVLLFCAVAGLLAGERQTVPQASAREGVIQPAQTSEPIRIAVDVGRSATVTGTRWEGITVRRLPSTEAEQVAVAKEKQRLQLRGRGFLTASGEWSPVSVDDSHDGWVLAKYLSGDERDGLRTVTRDGSEILPKSRSESLRVALPSDWVEWADGAGGHSHDGRVQVSYFAKDSAASLREPLQALPVEELRDRATSYSKSALVVDDLMTMKNPNVIRLRWHGPSLVGEDVLAAFGTRRVTARCYGDASMAVQVHAECARVFEGRWEDSR